MDEPIRLNIKLLEWYNREKRDLPWRHTQNPYPIWLSEVILQQTRVDQGLPYYHAFLNRYPTIRVLAAAPEQEVLKLWQGLGYYSRARNLLSTARQITEDHGGNFPKTYEGLLSLKGIGPYTAAAIASFAFDLTYAVVDGNVNRVLARLFDVHTPVNSTAGKKEIQALADAQLDQTYPAQYNQAIMELGAVVCTPAKPNCPLCPIQDHCLAFANGTVEKLPVKLKGKKAVDRHMDYAVLETADHFILRKRTSKDIWQGLHDFEALEGFAEPNAAALYKHIKDTLPELEVLRKSAFPERTYLHILSHQRLHARFWRIRVSGEINEKSIYLSVPKSELSEVAVPRLVHKYFEEEELI